MSVLPLVIGPSALLSQKSQPVLLQEESIWKLLLDLEQTLDAQTNPKGVGLSAIQIGIAKRVFLATTEHIEEGKTNVPIIFMNPRIIKSSLKMTSNKVNEHMLEGCLSLPQLYGEVKRHIWVEVEFETYTWDLVKTRTGIPQTMRMKFSDFAARVIQHEMDHLDGILFTQRVLEQNGRLYQSQIREGKEVLVEITLF